MTAIHLLCFVACAPFVGVGVVLRAIGSGLEWLGELLIVGALMVGKRCGVW